MPCPGAPLERGTLPLLHRVPLWVGLLSLLACASAPPEEPPAPPEMTEERGEDPGRLPVPLLDPASGENLDVSETFEAESPVQELAERVREALRRKGIREYQSIRHDHGVVFTWIQTDKDGKRWKGRYEIRKVSTEEIRVISSLEGPG